MPIPRCEWKGTTALTLTTLAVTGLSIYGVMYLKSTAQEVCENELQNLIDQLKKTSFSTPAIHDSITEPINLPAIQIDESGGIVIDIPSRTINVTIPINIPAFTVSLAAIIGENIVKQLDSIPVLVGKICADEVTMHASAYAGLVVLLFLFLTLGYACTTHMNRRMNYLENKLDFLNRQSPTPQETTHLLASITHRKNHSV
jgi:hypothetical protein